MRQRPSPRDPRSSSARRRPWYCAWFGPASAKKEPREWKSTSPSRRTTPTPADPLYAETASVISASREGSGLESSSNFGSSQRAMSKGVPVNSSFARPVRASASVFWSRGTCSNRMSGNRAASSRAHSTSGRRRGSLTFQRAHVCSMTSFESPRTRSGRSCSPLARIRSSPRIMPVYSATLLVAASLPGRAATP